MGFSLWSPGEVVEVEEGNHHILGDRIIVIGVIDMGGDVIHIGVEPQFGVPVKILVIVIHTIDGDGELVLHEPLDGQEALLAVNDIVDFVLVCDDHQGFQGTVLDDGENVCLLLDGLPHIGSLEIDSIGGKIDVEVILIIIFPGVLIGEGLDETVVEYNTMVDMDTLGNVVKAGGLSNLFKCLHS